MDTHDSRRVRDSDRGLSACDLTETVSPLIVGNEIEPAPLTHG
jgi:hypothetical protein